LKTESKAFVTTATPIQRAGGVISCIIILVALVLGLLDVVRDIRDRVAGISIRVDDDKLAQSLVIQLVPQVRVNELVGAPASFSSRRRSRNREDTSGNVVQSRVMLPVVSPPLERLRPDLV
jgi:hypothetical protein